MPETKPDVAPIRAALAPLLPHTLVALDFDGVLAPIVPRPEDARALPQAAHVLTEVARRVARVAIVTGRPALDAVRFGALEKVPGLVVCGHYGLERWRDGRVESPGEAAGIVEARSRATALIRDFPGTTIEDKGHSVAIHTRRADHPDAAFTALRPHAEAIAADTGLQLTPGRLVLELRPTGVDKGAALRDLVQEVSARAVVYAGDDLGDLPAVAAVRSLRTDGVTGVVVYSDSSEAVPEFREQADLVVDGPAGVLGVLQDLLIS
ncbi:trehalose-phosphatase [Phytoactinopolyspora halotolerans]|uniref:Trehalose 6-phosphate phosphatase n=1 Tax=Phytoactinopolyspora halotolerans TaxID=1981512 RepID=A0A6L9S4H0_9ACTN|nr:trehalose-phosphatase [Phytoactinopolyspora halotolerans]NED98919.1 trehalose-phosphatase [Phytoactinopolyspora halotolerans]